MLAISTSCLCFFRMILKQCLLAIYVLKYYYGTVIGLRCFKDFGDATAAEILSIMSSRPTRLRVKTRCPVFGKLSELAEIVLPIYEQVMIGPIHVLGLGST